MKIGIITYDVPHKKTQDIMLRMIGKDVTVIAMPFKERKPLKKLYWHRLDMNSSVSTIQLCEAFGFNYSESVNPLPSIDKDSSTEGIKLRNFCVVYYS